MNRDNYQDGENMHNQETTLIDGVILYGKSLYPAVSAAMISFWIAILRIMYIDAKNATKTPTKQIVLESMLCGFITLTLVSGSHLLGISQDASAFIGGTIGFIGVEKVRMLADKWVDREADILDEHVHIHTSTEITRVELPVEEKRGP